MRIVTIALAASALVAGVATAVVAQTASQPINPNTKVYAYKKAAPQPGNAGPSASSAMASQNNRAELADPPPYGSPKWWEEKARSSQGAGGD